MMRSFFQGAKERNRNVGNENIAIIFLVIEFVTLTSQHFFNSKFLPSVLYKPLLLNASIAMLGDSALSFPVTVLP